MRLFERALARTDLPVRFSEGFNPRPRLSLPLPRPVGIATTADVLVVEFAEPVDPREVLPQLAAQMPQGVALRDAWLPSGRRPIQPASATYALDLPADRIRETAEQVDRILNSPEWPVHRVREDGGPEKVLDLRSYLLNARIDGSRLRWTMRVTGQGSIRPGEFLAAVGLAPDQWQHRICRTDIAWHAGSAERPRTNEILHTGAESPGEPE